MGLKVVNTAEAAVIIADKSPAQRRTYRKLIEQQEGRRFAIREASTVHAINVLLRELNPSLVIASDEITGGDGELLAGTIRDAGYTGRVILTLGNTRNFSARANGFAALDAVPRAAAADLLPGLLGTGETAGRGKPAAPGKPTARTKDSDGDEIVPFRIEERRIIESALRRFGGNIGKAARALEISPSTIYRKIQTWHADISA